MRLFLPHSARSAAVQEQLDAFGHYSQRFTDELLSLPKPEKKMIINLQESPVRFCIHLNYSTEATDMLKRLARKWHQHFIRIIPVERCDELPCPEI